MKFAIISLIFLFLGHEINQIPSLIVDVASLSLTTEKLHQLELEIILDFENNNPSQILRLPYPFWKKYLLDVLQDKKNHPFTFIDSSFNEHHVFLFHNTNELSNMKCLRDNNESYLVPTKTFMRFKVSKLTETKSIDSNRLDPTLNPNLIPNLRQSFKHEMTYIGLLTLERLEYDLLNRFQSWLKDETELMAPIVSLCQSSGTGKSKFSLEMLKKHIGFYIVFRQKDEAGYPLKNCLSDILFSLVKSYNDPMGSLDDINYAECTVGKILNFLANLVVFTMRQIFISCQQKGINCLDAEIKNFAKRFENNEILEDCLLSNEEMNDLYANHIGNFNPAATVKQISNYIKTILKSPESCIQVESLGDQEILQNLQIKLRNFPFLLVIDEAELLAKFHVDHLGNLDLIISGFEAFRRAISYLEPETPLLVLTLGTHSNVIDLNPQKIDNSKRFKKRNKIPFPIVLSSNLNILSEEFPIYKLTPTYKMLLNPLMFKFLCTLGHGIWCSVSFNACVDIAKSKLKNGTSETKNYVVALWMIRAGLAANPFHVEAGKLVASHMATLLNISPDLKELTVNYPSEPILAIAARDLISELTDDALFRVLKAKFEAVSIDRGRIAEVFAAMIVLRAIDKSTSIVFPVTDYDLLLDDITKLAPDFKELWQADRFILEADEAKQKRKEISEIKNELMVLERDYEELQKQEKDLDILNEFKRMHSLKKNDLESLLKSIPFPVINFPDYRVYKIKSFLESLIASNIDKKIEALIPSKILNGIINATHFVSLIRDSKGFQFSSAHFPPDSLPMADSRIPDKTRNVIDLSLLKIGLIRQCGFVVPAGGYGFDFFIPACLEDGVYTFIGIQVKRARANSLDDIFKMQSRLHLVAAKCSDPKCDRKCGQCFESESLKSIYENQLTLLISLDEEDTFDNFEARLNFFNGCTEDSLDILLNSLKKGTVPESKVEPEERADSGASVAETETNTEPRSDVVETENLTEVSSKELVRKGTRNRTETQFFSKTVTNPVIKKPKTSTCTSESIQEKEYDLKDVTPRSESFFEPLIHRRIPLAGNVMISQSLWADECVGLKKIRVGKQLIDFKPDGFVHRQFCVSTRGWNSFRHLLANFESSVKIANEILAIQVFFDSDLSRENSDLIRKVIYDTAPSFFEYSEELRRARNQESYLHQLEIEAKNQRNLLPFSTKKEEKNFDTNTKLKNISDTETTSNITDTENTSIKINSMLSAQIEAIKSKKYPANIGEHLIQFSDEETETIYSESAASSTKSQKYKMED